MTRSKKESPSTADTKLKTTPIAIIGMGSIFPGARTTQVYWDNILRKIDCISDVPASRWKIEDYYDPDPSVPDKVYSKRGGFIPDVDFDPMEFGLPPNILEVTDVSQLLSLVVAREALEDAGYGEDREFNREATGVILGVVGMSSKLFSPLMNRLQYPIWEKVLRSSGVSESDTQRIIEKIKLAYVGWEENAFPGAIGNVISGRICNRFDLGGVNCVTDAACASSLAAVKMAVGELVEGRADMMITGGVDTDNSITTYMCFSKTPAFSKGDRVRTFDADSDGMMVGEGIGMVVLKRLEDAERDGDRVYAVIKAVGTSSDGRFKSIYAPRPSGQARALRRAYAEAGFPPDRVGLIEAHGTGTLAGDPAEFQGMNEVFGEANACTQSIALGSVKSQIAHTKAAAGVASLIKTALALHHKVLPPTINVNRPNPRFNIENTPFYINTETRPWMWAGHPRRAGVSSFGFGGTNFHVVMEEAQAEHQGAYRINTVAQPVLLAAADPDQLQAACTDALNKLQGEQAEANFTDLVKARRDFIPPATSSRVGFVAETVEEARQLLQICIDSLAKQPQAEQWEHPKGIFYRRTGLDTQGRVVALFSGQGSQYLEMGRELAINFPVVREVYAAMDKLFKADRLEPLSARVYPRPVFDPQEREALSGALTRTEHAQPAIGSFSASLFKLLQQAGFQPDFTAGHSFGELTALWAAGVLVDTDYYALAKARGKAMAPPDDPDFDAGTMAAVKGEAEKIREVLKDDPEVTLANWNSNDQVVIAGSKPAIARAREALEAQGFKTVPLPVSAAFHTPLVKHAQKPFAQAIRSVTFRAPKVRVYSNSTAQEHSSEPAAIRELLAGHILNPVLFRDEIENIYAAGGTIFVEFGPKNVLTNLVDNILSGKPHLAVALNANAKKDSDRQLREAVMALRVAGIPLNNFDPYEVVRNVRPPRKKSPVNVKINGGLYMTEKTRAAFEKALQDGFKITLPGGQPAPAVPSAALPAGTPTVPQPDAADSQVAAPVVAATPQETVSASNFNDMSSPTRFENLLAEYQAHQSETLRLHEQYLRTEEEYARAFAQLTGLQTELVSKGSAASDELPAILPLFESLERSMLRFHEHQAETLRIHQRYLETQERFSQTFVSGIAGGTGTPPAPVSSAPVQRPTVPQASVSTTPRITDLPASLKNGNGNGSAARTFPSNEPTPGQPVAAPAPLPEIVVPAVAAPVVTERTVQAAAPLPVSPCTTSVGEASLKNALLQIVSDKTGYPVETLELDMDMEADLGIDSIKRVEILGAVQEQFPSLPKIETNVLAELRTLGQILDQMGSVSAPAATASAPVPAVEAPRPVSPIPTAAPAAGGLSVEAATQSLLQIVSDKTGYPVETLELDMDMEADLGIDSIKRVEILGAMQDQHPELPKIEAAVLAELRTLGQIVQQVAGSQATEEAVPAASSASHTAGDVNTAAEAQPSNGLDSAVLQAALLQIVSDKTGYPVETLELDMDMEADLGIDSIKRVEILGAMQEEYPQLPKLGAETLAELRTLGQIVAKFSAIQDMPAGEAAQPPFDFTPFDPGVSQGVVIRKTLPAPDFLDFTLPAGYSCLITDDGTTAAPALAQALLEKNWPVFVLRFAGLQFSQDEPATRSFPAGAVVVELPDMSEAALQTALEKAASEHGPAAVFIHLAPQVSGREGGEAFRETEKTLLKLVFLAAKHLQPSLNQAALHGRAVFMTVTRLDGAFGLGERDDFSPVSGGLSGLVKTLNLEWEAVFCRAVDIHPAVRDHQVVDCILSELHDPNRLVTEVGYTMDERSTLALAAVSASVGTLLPVTGGKA